MHQGLTSGVGEVDPAWAEPDETKITSLATVLGVDAASEGQWAAVSGALALTGNDPDAALNRFFDDPDACVAVGQVLVDRAADEAHRLLEPEPEPEPAEDGVGLSRQGSSGSAGGGWLGWLGRKLQRQSSAEKGATFD